MDTPKLRFGERHAQRAYRLDLGRTLLREGHQGYADLAAPSVLHRLGNRPMKHWPHSLRKD